MKNNNKRHPGYIAPIDIRRERNNLVLSWKWKTSKFLLFFSAFWNVITFTVLGAFIFAELSSMNDLSISNIFASLVKNFNPAFIIGITHPAVGFITGYLALASLINNTTIKINNQKISIVSSPLPWPGYNKVFDSSKINRLRVEEYVAYTQNDNPIYKFKILGEVSGVGDSVVIIKGIHEEGIADTIIENISNELGIDLRTEQVA